MDSIIFFCDIMAIEWSDKVNPYVVLNMYSLMLLIVIMIIFFRKQRIHAAEDTTYSYLLITLCITCLFGIINSMLFSYRFDLQELLIKAFGKLYLAGLFIVFYCFTFYSILLSKKKELKIGNIFALIISIFILLLPLDLKYSGDEILIEGLSSNFAYLTFGLCYLVMIFSILTAKEKKIKLLPVLLFILMGLGVLIIQSYVGNVNYYINPAIVFIVLIMYHTIENPDVKMIEVVNQARLSAEKANRAKSDFLSSMSHEIRTPLNAIVGFSDCILDEETLEAAKNDAKDIKLASENLLEIVNGILDISKIEANKMEVVETNYNPVEILENVAKLVKPRIAEKPIEMVTSFASDLPYLLYGDGGKIRQIITNILTNAAKYTEEGRITFSVNCVNEGEYSRLVISVEDTGRGIKPEQIDKLFTKFQRLDEDKNTTLEGTGLGLAITKKFVEMLGGKIVVQSKYGEGSKFTVYLQQKIVSLEKPEEKVLEQMTSANNFHKDIDYTTKKILIVDDNKINLKVASKLLSNFGINADTVESGFDCLDKIKTNEKYDLILLDDMMPKMSGVETLKKLKEIEGFNTPVVALTANAISGMREQYLGAGFTDYLSKPIEKNELARVLNTYLK